MFRVILCPSSGAWDWDIYSIWCNATAHCLLTHHNNGIPYAV